MPPLPPLDLAELPQQAAALAALLPADPQAATTTLANWRKQLGGTAPLSQIAMARYDTATGVWGDVPGTAAMAHALVAAGAPVEGDAGDSETPLMTAASYGDAGVAAVLIAAGAHIDALAAANAGGVPGGSALLHAAVFGMTDVVDVLMAAGARVRSMEEAGAGGDLAGWSLAAADEQTRVRSFVMAAHHQRLAVLDALAAAGTPIDSDDEVFGRHPLRLAAAEGRPLAVRHLLAMGADPAGRDSSGLTALDHCRHGRRAMADTSGHDAVEALLAG